MQGSDAERARKASVTVTCGRQRSGAGDRDNGSKIRDG